MLTSTLSRIRTRPDLPRASAALLLMILASPPALAAGGCHIAQLAQLPVTMADTHPTVHALINGADSTFIADSGAFFNSMTPAAALEYKLPQRMAPMGFWVSGTGGSAARASLATVKEFTILGAKFPNVLFVVAGNDFGSAAGLLGQNLFRIADAEFDLANGAIRLMRPAGDCKSMGLAYWTAGGPYSQIDISRQTDSAPHIIGDVYLNGVKITAMFDTGAGTSVVSLEAAKRAGITPTSEGVKQSGVSYGVGTHFVQRWIAPFHSFKIGDEEIRDIRLHIGSIGALPQGAEMLVGPDFFLSHRVMVASDRAKLYFTYNGGPVFNLGIRSKAEQAPNEAVAVAGGVVAANNEPTDAAAYGRRAALAANRREYASAVADLDRACELAPDNPDYRYQRGMAHWGADQAEAALADFNAALKLKPDHVPSLLARAQFLIETDVPAATADLQAADSHLPREAVEHLDIASVYMDGDVLGAAVVQLSKWIDSHERTDVRMASVLNTRCWARALSGHELDAALADCNGAVRLQSSDATYLDSRGLVYLRMGNYDKAIADYNAALALNPKIAWSHYGRGIARLHKGLEVDGKADLAAAKDLVPKIAETAAKYGITP